jgi:hypothetical protein
VAASAPNDVWAVGDGILHWNGSAWSRNQSANFPPLNAVTAISTIDAWAVGDAGIWHWDGSTWHSVPGPAGILYKGIAAISPTDIWAVGGTGGIGPHQRAVHWDGQAWTADPLDEFGTLYAVTARNSGDVWAVGTVNSSTIYDPYITVLHWAGQTWQTIPATSPSTHRGSYLRGVALVPGATDVWTVGNAYSGDSLTERWQQPACSAPPQTGMP